MSRTSWLPALDETQRKRLAAATVLALLSVLPVLADAPAAATDCVVTAAGDIAGSSDPEHHEYINALRTGDVVRAVAPTYALTLGDNAYDGDPVSMATMYDPTWGSFKATTKPSPGNHEYEGDNAAGYFDYFFGGQRAGNEYYATTCGAWRLYSLNCEIACGSGSAQLAWLEQDLAQHPGLHYLGYLHEPRFTSGSSHSPNTSVAPVWAALQRAGGDVVVSAHNHNYERFAKQSSSGTADPAGMRQFVVGTGGAGTTGFDSPEPNSQFRDAEHFGVLKLVLADESYSWEFLSAGRHEVNGSGEDDSAHPLGTVLDSGTTPTNTAAGGNRAPVVSAGADVSVASVPGSVGLAGSVSDDGLPVSPGVVTTAWSLVSGPGAVVFGDPAAVDTTASVSVAGSYVLRLSATDGELSSSDDVVLTAGSGGGGGGTAATVEVRVVAGVDDAEQSVGSGSVSTSSSDLELGADGSTAQIVGVRFRNVQLPAGATVTAAWVQFRTAARSRASTTLVIRAEDSDSAPAYASTGNNIGSRATTAASVGWSPPSWDRNGEVGAAQRTPNVAALVQAVAGRTGWASGNALALQFTGTGRRTASSFEHGASRAPLLHVEYTVP